MGVSTPFDRIRVGPDEAVNKELVGLYWDIGRLIVERQKDAKQERERL